MNTFRVHYGDMLFLYALDDMEPGVELTTSYCRFYETLKERADKLKKYGFICSCRLCTLDRANPVAEERREKLVAFTEQLYRK